MRQPAEFRKMLRAPLLLAVLLTGARLLFLLLDEARYGTAAPRNRSRNIIQNASDAIISTDETQRIVLANPSAAAMFGTTVQAMQGAPLRQFIPRGGDRALPQQSGQLRGQTHGRRATDDVLTGQKASGVYFPLEGSISTQPEDGHEITTIILRDITERLQVQRQLQQSYTQLRELSAALQTIREEERTHISRELHDDLGQLLATLRMDLSLLRQQPPGSPVTPGLLHSMDDLLLTAITSLRRIAANLRPRALDEGGLYFALEGLCQDFARRHAIGCRLDAVEDELVLDERYSTAIFRIVQEALTNIARHAQASNAWLRLRRDNGALRIAIEDDGRGISDSDMDKAASFGLIGMRERVWAIHGDIAIGSDGSSGTRIDIRMPLPPREPAAQ